MSHSSLLGIRVDSQLRLSSIMAQVYAWMTAGLFLTGAVAAITARSQVLMELVFGNPATIWVLFLAQLGLVVAISAGIKRVSSVTATMLFLLYATLNGFTLSTIFLVYSGTSIAVTFLITAGTFGVMSLYGYVTKRDLTTIGNLLVMALFGLILASVVNMFFASTTLSWVLTYAGVVIFVGLIAYDTQKIKQLTTDLRQWVSPGQIAILGALTLYLDFLNLFLYLLNLLDKMKK